MKKAISAQRTRMYLEDPNGPAAGSGILTAGSRSKPCVLQFDSVERLRHGAAILVMGTGYASIDSRTWILQDIDEDTKSASLANSDTTNDGAWQADAAWLRRGTIDVCAVSYAINQTAAAQIDTTTLCDDAKTYLVGFSDPGQLTFDFFIDPTDPDYQVLLQAQKDGDERYFEIVYRNLAVHTLPVIVQSINESGGVDGAITGAATLKVTGAPVLTMPPGVDVANYVLIATVTPTEGDAPLDVTMTLHERGGVASKFTIDWKDGTATTETTTHIATHTYANQGEYRATIVATIAGHDTAPFNAQNIVTVIRPYTWAIQTMPANSTGVAPFELQLLLTQGGGTAEFFTVNWGDGSEQQAVTPTPIPRHTYEDAGVFTLTAQPTRGGVALDIKSREITATAP